MYDYFHDEIVTLTLNYLMHVRLKGDCPGETFAIQLIHTLFSVFNNQHCLALLYRNADPDKMSIFNSYLLFFMDEYLLLLRYYFYRLSVRNDTL